MTRTLLFAAALALSLESGSARASQAQFNAFVLTLPNLVLYWPFSANTSALAGATPDTDASCTGSCGFAQPIAVNVSGYLPGSPSSGINIDTGLFAASPSGWSTAFMYKSNSTAAVAFQLGSAAFSPVLETFLVNPTAQCASQNAEFWLVNPGTTIACGTSSINDGQPHLIGAACTVSGGSAIGCNLVVDGHTQATLTLTGASVTTLPAGYTFGGDPYSSGQITSGPIGALIQASAPWPDSVFLSIYRCAIAAPLSCGLTASKGGGGGLVN